MAGGRTIGSVLRRWVLRGLAGLVCLLLVLLTGLALCLPWVVERLAERELARRGVGDNVTVGVRAVSWDGAVLGPVAVRDAGGLLQADTVAIGYTLSGLRRGQIDDVRLTGVRLPVTRRGDGWRVGGLETLSRLAAQMPTGSGTAAAEPAGDLIVGLRSSHIEVMAGARTLTLPVEGTVRLPARGPCQVRGTCWLQGEAVTLTAALDLASGAGTASVACRQADLAAWLRAAALLDLGLPETTAEVLSGEVSCRATVGIVGKALGQLEAEAVVSALELRVANVPVSVPDAELSLRAGSDLRALDVTLRGHTGTLAMGGRTVAPFAFSGSWHDDTAEGAVDGLDVDLGDGLALRGRARLAVHGTNDLATARWQLGADVTELLLPGVAPFAGRLEAAGTTQELHVGGALETLRPETVCGLRTLVLDGQARREHGLEAEAIVTAVVDPELAARALAPSLAVTAASLPVELTAVLTWPEGGTWRCTGKVGVAKRHLEVTTDALRAGADAALESQFAVAPDGVTASGRLDLSALTAHGYSSDVTAEALEVTVSAARCPFPGALTSLSVPELRQALAGVTIEGRAALRKAALRGPGGLVCDGIALDLPVAWSVAGGLLAPGGQAGQLQTGAIRMDAIEAAGARGRILLEGRRARVEAELAGTAPAVTITLEQSVDWSRGLALALHYRVPSFQVRSEDTWYRRFLGVEGLQVQGLVSAEGDVRFDGRGLRTPCRAVLTAGEVKWPAHKLSITGIAASLDWRDLLQVQTAPFQEVRFASAKVYDVPVDGGRLVFQLDGPQSLCLERCELNWCKGLVHTQALQLNLADPEVDLVLFAENVDFVTALALIKGFKGKGTGVLNGKLPISYRHGRLSYSRGYLYSVPGQGGRLELQSAGLLTSTVPPDHPSYSELRRAEKALEEFRLDLFRLDFVGKQAGEPGARILLVGEGINEKVPVHLNLNVNGAIEDAINMGLRLGGM